MFIASQEIQNFATMDEQLNRHSTVTIDELLSIAQAGDGNNTNRRTFPSFTRLPLGSSPCK